MRPALISLLVALSIGFVSAGSAVSKLERLCSERKSKLTTVAELNELVAELELGAPNQCEEHVIKALRDLKSLTSDDTACTMTKAKAVMDFVDNYLKDNDRKAIPKALSNFAVAYGMQMTDACSREMVHEFSNEATNRLREKLGKDKYKEFKQFKEYLVEESPVGVMLTPILETGEVILPADLMELVPELGADKLELHLPDTRWRAELGRICNKLLQPLYEPILLPLAHMLRAGFEGETKFWLRRNKDESRFWSTAVFLCESLKMVEVKQGESGGELVNALGELRDETKAMAELKDEEEEAEEGERPGQVEAQAHEPEGQLAAVDTPVEEYESKKKLKNKVYHVTMGPMVRAFDANKREVEHLRKRIMRRGMRMMRVLFRKGKYRSMFGELLKLIKVKRQTDAESFETTKRKLVEFVESPQSDTLLYKATHNRVTSLAFMLLLSPVMADAAVSITITAMLGLVFLLPIRLTTVKEVKEFARDSAGAVYRVWTLGQF